MENGRERQSFFLGVHSHRGLQRKEGIYFGLKIKEQKYGGSKLHVTELGVDWG